MLSKVVLVLEGLNTDNSTHMTPHNTLHHTTPHLKLQRKPHFNTPHNTTLHHNVWHVHYVTRLFFLFSISLLFIFCFILFFFIFYFLHHYFAHMNQYTYVEFYTILSLFHFNMISIPVFPGEIFPWINFREHVSVNKFPWIKFRELVYWTIPCNIRKSMKHILFSLKLNSIQFKYSRY